MTDKLLTQIADSADVIVNGYAFTNTDTVVRVLNLNNPDSAAVIDSSGEIIETSMDDIEQRIVLGYFQTNSKYMVD